MLAVRDWLHFRVHICLSLLIRSGENPSKKSAESAFSCNQPFSQAAFMGILAWIPSGPFVRRESIPSISPSKCVLISPPPDTTPPRR